VKNPLIAIVVLSALSGTAHSQNSPQTGREQPVHPGTAILESMGIYPGNPMPKQAGPQPDAENAPASQTNAQASRR